MIVHKDRDFVVVSKPAPLLVHQHPRFPNEYPLLQRVRDELGHYVWPVHRLDRPTSGCLIMACNREAIASLSQALREGKKYYWALVRGILTEKGPIEVRTPIKKNKLQYQDAHSTVWSIGSNTEPRCSMVRVQIHTGRNHQVRRHLRDLNHPIIHDGDHGDSRINRWWRENLGLKRLALHSGQLEFQYQGQQYKFMSPFPHDLRIVLEKLPFWTQIKRHFN
ncbi:MAG: RluA family pseudouridine synthase [Myxococcota bacterium]